MHNTVQPHFAKSSSWLSRLLWGGLLVVALSACGVTIPEQTASTPEAFDYIIDIAISESDLQADIEAAYGGSTVVWRPEAGFAVLGLYEGQLSTLSRKAESNQDTFATPESDFQAQGWTAWGGGWTAWGGGWTAWGGGWTAWGGGTSGEPTTLAENNEEFNLIKLAAGQKLAPNLGAGVKVAVIDSGIDLDHPALEGKLAPANEWKDFVDGDQYPEDVYDAATGASNFGYGHGTAAAGAIIQVAPNATILPIRVLSPDGRCDATSLAAAIDWAVEKGADVINLSIGGPSEVRSIQRMLDYAASKGVYMVASSGNTGNQAITYPANAARADNSIGQYLIGVGSINTNDQKSVFSTYGGTLEVVAPGEDIFTLSPQGGVTSRTGTSFSAPIVTGTVALALGEPDLSFPLNAMATGLVSMSSTSIYDGRNPGFDGMLGQGRLDVEAYIQTIKSFGLINTDPVVSPITPISSPIDLPAL